MPEYVRALCYVLAVAAPALFLAGRLAVPLIGAKEFRLWRNSWLATTVLAFLSNNFLTFAALVGLMTLIIQRQSRNPAMLYIVLLSAAPCVGVGVGIPGLVNRVMDLDLPRLLCLSILLPMAVSFLRDGSNTRLRGADLPLLGFWMLLMALTARHGDAGSILRLALGYAIDVLLPYFVFSRTIRSREDLNRGLLAFAVGALPLAAIGLFEVWRSWRVYYVVVLEWDVVLITPYLFRDGLLRGATTAIEPIAFGYLCMVAAGCLVSLHSPKVKAHWRWLSLSLLVGGLAASISRGPWLGFGLLVVIVFLADPKARRLLAALTPALFAAVFVMPNGVADRLVNLLPFIGSADRGSETYRGQLFEQSLAVIERNPLFGSKDFLAAPELQVMMQGQGIIDIVNSYLQVVLEYGIVGLVLFVAIFAVIAVQLTSRWAMEGRHGVYYQGLLGVLASICFTIATTSSVSYISAIYWVFAGLSAGLLRLPAARKSVQANGGQAGPLVPQMRILGRGI